MTCGQCTLALGTQLTAAPLLCAGQAVAVADIYDMLDSSTGEW